MINFHHDRSKGPNPPCTCLAHVKFKHLSNWLDFLPSHPLIPCVQLVSQLVEHVKSDPTSTACTDVPLSIRLPHHTPSLSLMRHRMFPNHAALPQEVLVPRRRSPIPNQSPHGIIGWVRGSVRSLPPNPILKWPSAGSALRLLRQHQRTRARLTLLKVHKDL